MGNQNRPPARDFGQSQVFSDPTPGQSETAPLPRLALICWLFPEYFPITREVRLKGRTHDESAAFDETPRWRNRIFSVLPEIFQMNNANRKKRRFYYFYRFPSPEHAVVSPRADTGWRERHAGVSASHNQNSVSAAGEERASPTGTDGDCRCRLLHLEVQQRTFCQLCLMINVQDSLYSFRHNRWIFHSLQITDFLLLREKLKVTQPGEARGEKSHIHNLQDVVTLWPVASSVWGEGNVKINPGVWTAAPLDEYWLKNMRDLVSDSCSEYYKVWSWKSVLHAVTLLLQESFFICRSSKQNKSWTPEDDFQLASFSIFCPPDLLASFWLFSLQCPPSPHPPVSEHLLLLSFPSDITCTRADQSFTSCFFISSSCPCSTAEVGGGGTSHIPFSEFHV